MVRPRESPKAIKIRLLRSEVYARMNLDPVRLSVNNAVNSMA
jgi:hypothetical protein